MARYEPLDPMLVNDFNIRTKRAPGAPLCYAPFNNIAFDTLGRVGACYQSYFSEDELRIPRATIRDIWFSKQFQRLREHIIQKDLNYKCKTCKKFLEERAFLTAPINGYRPYEKELLKYPSSMEFELSNKCNLECIMCTGSLSSNVRKNRDNLPPLLSPYDDKFVEQLREFIPHLKEMKFLGGEPTLINTYYRIWELATELNPEILFFVTTNANNISTRFKEILEKGNFQINVSIDSLVKENYEKIRIGGNFEAAMENIHWYIDYCRRKGKDLQLSFIPMTLNWHEVPDLIAFANKNHVRVWLHTLTTPENLHLKNLSSQDLEDIIYDLREKTVRTDFRGPDLFLDDSNMNVYRGFLDHQLMGWYADALQRNPKNDVYSGNVPAKSSFLRESFFSIQSLRRRILTSSVRRLRIVSSSFMRLWR